MDFAIIGFEGTIRTTTGIRMLDMMVVFTVIIPLQLSTILLLMAINEKSINLTVAILAFSSKASTTPGDVLFMCILLESIAFL